MAVSLIAATCTGRMEGSEDASEALVAEDNSGYKMITARVSIKPEYTADFIEAAGPLIDSSNMEPGCISYQLYQDPYDQTRFIFVEEWTDQAAIDNHFSMSYFIAFGPKVEEWQSDHTELKIIDAVASE